MNECIILYKLVVRCCVLQLNFEFHTGYEMRIAALTYCVGASADALMCRCTKYK